MLTRREMMAGLAAGAGLGLVPSPALAGDKTTGGPKRVIFFLQNHGFDPHTCIPEGVKESCSLDGVTASSRCRETPPLRVSSSWQERQYFSRKGVVLVLNPASPSHGA